MATENIGYCPNCGTPNSLVALNCHKCNARLPWADPTGQSATQPSLAPQPVGQPTVTGAPGQPPYPYGTAPGVPVKKSGSTWLFVGLGLAGCGFFAMIMMAAILFPVFAKARENARRASCQNNLKQLSLAAMMYAQDYDAYPPAAIGGPGMSSASLNGLPFGWADALQPYHKNLQVLQCPSESNPYKSNPSPQSPNYTDYFYNSNLSRRPLIKISSPATTILNGDGDGGTNGNAAYAINAPLSSDAATRHLDGASYSFVDGHVKWYKPERLLSGAQF